MFGPLRPSRASRAPLAAPPGALAAHSPLGRRQAAATEAPRSSSCLPALAYTGRLALAGRAGTRARPLRDAAVAHLRVAEGAPGDLAGALALARTEASAPPLPAPVPAGPPCGPGLGGTHRDAPAGPGGVRVRADLLAPGDMAAGSGPWRRPGPCACGPATRVSPCPLRLARPPSSTPPNRASRPRPPSMVARHICSPITLWILY